MLYKLRIRVVMQNRYLVMHLGVRLLWPHLSPLCSAPFATLLTVDAAACRYGLRASNTVHRCSVVGRTYLGRI